MIRRILILLVLVAALGTYLYVYELPEAAREGKKAKLLGVDKDAITGVVLTYPDRELELRKDDQGWRLVRPAEAPADDTVVKGVLSTLTDAEVQKTLGELPQNLADFGVQQSRWSKGFVQVARKLLPQVWNSNWSGEAKFTTTVALGQQLIFPSLVLGILALIVSIVGHGHLLGFFRFLLWLWLAGVLGVLIGMTFGAYRLLRRGSFLNYLVTAASVPALIVYLAAANAGAIVGALLGKKTEFVRTPKTGT